MKEYKITFSCGHGGDSLDDGIEADWKDWNNEDNVPVHNFGMLCKECYKEYKESGRLLNNEQEIYDWINNE
jgi:hypothetical protein